MRLFSDSQVALQAKRLNIASVAHAGIAEILSLAQSLEHEYGIPFVKMDQGSPGLPPNWVGIQAEIKALESGVVSIYPPSEGIDVLKKAGSRFLKAFLNVEVDPRFCIPTAGSVEGSFIASTICTQMKPGKDTILFLDPGFPIQKAQLAITGARWRSFDIYRFRGNALRDKLEAILSEGNVAALLYANPSNPAWLCFSERELQIIAEVAAAYDVVVIEDLAYFGMDSRVQYGTPNQEPYIPTIASYSGNYILLLSSSKIFSYAGQRMALLCVGEPLFETVFPALTERYHNSGVFGATLVNSMLELLTSGCSTSAQYAYAAMLNAACDGALDFSADMSLYASRARKMKSLFQKNGFEIVYGLDEDREIGDGFFFTIGYGAYSSEELVMELLYYGISTISLGSTGAELAGVRCCSSQMTEPMMSLLEERLDLFRQDHPTL